MSDTNTQNPTSSKIPTHAAYQVKDREGGKNIWTRVGSAWAHADSKGFNVLLESLPRDGRVALRVITEKKN